MKSVFSVIESINEWVGRIFSWLIIPLVFIVVLEIVMRKFFNNPTSWSFEVSKQIYGFYFMICAGYTLKHKGHVGIDVFSKSFSQRTSDIIEIICYMIFFFPFCFVLLYYGTLFAVKSWKILETGWGVFAIPLYPIKTVIPVSAALLLLQGVSDFIRTVSRLFLRGNHV